MSNYTRQRFTLHRVERRDHFYTLFCNVLCWLSLSSCYLVAAFELRRLEIFWKMNLDQTAVSHKNNFGHKGMKLTEL